MIPLTTQTILTTASISTDSILWSSTSSEMIITATLKEDEPTNHTILIVVLSITILSIVALSGGIVYWRRRALVSRRLLQGDSQISESSSVRKSAAYELDDFSGC